MNRLIAISGLCLALMGCGAEDGGEGGVSVDDLSQNPSSRIATSTVAPGEMGCEAGGVKIDMGFDQNENHVLDDHEVSDSYIVCHGVDGSDGQSGSDGQDGFTGFNGEDGLNSLIKVYDESAGSNCEYGGKRIVTGLDLNADELLSSNEIEDTQYLCNLEPLPALAGLDGSSCSVLDNQDGSATISCEDGTSATVGEDNGPIDYVMWCAGSMAGDFSGISWTLESTEFSNGSTFVQASVDDGYVSSSSSYFTLTGEEAVVDYTPVLVNFDPYMNSNHGYWKFSFDLVNLGVNVTFYDNDLVDDQEYWFGGFADFCTLYDYTTP